MGLTGVAAIANGDAALIALAQRGDQDAFAALIGPRSDRVLRMARAIVGEDAAAHDAVQNALVSAWVHLPRLKDSDRFDAWINRVVRNECLQALRRKRRVREIQMSTIESSENAISTSDHSSDTLETHAVKNAFRRLSVDDRMILLLHHLHGLSLEDVARQLGVSVGAARSRLFRARRALERALETER